MIDAVGIPIHACDDPKFIDAVDVRIQMPREIDRAEMPAAQQNAVLPAAGVGGATRRTEISRREQAYEWLAKVQLGPDTERNIT
ncbi:hypothetical protein, partial [Dyella sp. ASV21]|uniref:hypothetical protein n=1 Tax=Dyella sp. ASV21 TaxID=2795114 RepID=UPI001E516444